MVRLEGSEKNTLVNPRPATLGCLIVAGVALLAIPPTGIPGAKAALPARSAKERDQTATRQDLELLQLSAPVSADESVMVAGLNDFRQNQKVGKLRLDKRLFALARANALADAQGKRCPRKTVKGYAGTFRLAVPGPTGTTPQQMVTEILKQNIFRNQIADGDAKAIGVGLAVDKNGITRYVVIFGIEPD